MLNFQNEGGLTFGRTWACNFRHLSHQWSFDRDGRPTAWGLLDLCPQCCGRYCYTPTARFVSDQVWLRKLDEMLLKQRSMRVELELHETLVLHRDVHRYLQFRFLLKTL